MSDFDADAFLDAIEAACARGDHDFDGSFTHPPVCPDCGAEK